MQSLYQALLFTHMAVGFVSLITFWIPVVVKKGSRPHIRTGHWYAKAMYGVGITAILLSAMAAADPIGIKAPNEILSFEKEAQIIAEVRDIALFLFSISVLTITNVRMGLLSLQAKRNHSLLRAPSNLALIGLLATVALMLFYTASGGTPLSILFYVFAGLCAFNAITNFRYIILKKVTYTDRIVTHLTNMIGAGIGAHTAFLLFGASRLIAHLLVGYWQLVPWILPGVVGSIIIIVQARKYRNLSKASRKA